MHQIAISAVRAAKHHCKLP